MQWFLIEFFPYIFVFVKGISKRLCVADTNRNTNRNNKDDDKIWPYRMLIFGPSGSVKTNALLNLIKKQNNDNPIDKIYLYVKYLSEPKYQFLIEKRDNAGIKNYNDPSAFK